MTNQNKMREQFEEECADWEMDTSRDSEGDYVDRQARRGWNLWQAATAYAGAATPKAAQGDAIPREDFAWLVVQEACETDPADEDDPECIRILRRDLKSAVLAAFLRYDAENHGIAWGAYQAGHADAKAGTAAAERDYWRKELHALLEAADAVATNNAHAVSTGSARYAKYSQTWEAYASLDKARQRADSAPGDEAQRGV